jgi:hypothetical protein
MEPEFNVRVLERDEEGVREEEGGVLDVADDDGSFRKGIESSKSPSEDIGKSGSSKALLLPAPLVLVSVLLPILVVLLLSLLLTGLLAPRPAFLELLLLLLPKRPPIADVSLDTEEVVGVTVEVVDRVVDALARVLTDDVVILEDVAAFLPTVPVPESGGVLLAVFAELEVGECKLVGEGVVRLS